MQDVQIILSGIWAALMLTYLSGDILRIVAGDVTPGEVEGKKMTQKMLMGMAIFMLIPIVMLILSLTLAFPVNRLVNIIIALGLFVFSLIGLPTYPGAYDKFLIIVGLGFNALTVWYAWNWV
ncbi:MAG: DUF6326 family protein [Candidatus Hodarchaeales archaeon]|jgi:hypothetical protein